MRGTSSECLWTRAAAERRTVLQTAPTWLAKTEKGLSALQHGRYPGTQVPTLVML